MTRKNDDQKILISVIIPVYNKEKYVINAIESVIKQIRDNVEIIIVDDGSTDMSAEIVDKFAEKYDFIKVIHQKNQWVYASFNNGVKAANGEYIYILNSDDCIYDGLISVLIDKLSQYDGLDVIWTKCITCHCDSNQICIKTNKTLRDRMISKEIYYKNAEEVRKNWAYFDQIKVTFAQSNLYRRDLVLEHPFRNDVYGADQLFNIEIAPYINSALVIPNDAYQYYVYDGEGLNVSVGGFYPYSHYMWNELYLNRINKYKLWGILNRESKENLKDFRCAQITGEIREMASAKCPWNIDEKLYAIFFDYMNDDVMTDILSVDREQVEARVLSGVRELILKTLPDKKSKMYFVYELLDGLLKYEKDEDDLEKIKNAIYNDLNPKRIGLCFYKKLLK